MKKTIDVPDWTDVVYATDTSDVSLGEEFDVSDLPDCRCEEMKQQIKSQSATILRLIDFCLENNINPRPIVEKKS